MSKLVVFSGLGTIVLGGLFLSILLRPEPRLENPLINLDKNKDPLHSAVLEKEAPVLTGEIKNDISGKFILRGTAFIPKESSVKIKDSKVFAERDSKIEVLGEANIINSTFSSNQIHPTRKYWYGLVVSDQGKITADKVTIKDAVAGITCSGKSRMIINNSTLENNVVGIVAMPTQLCQMKDSTISQGRVGVQVLGGSPLIDNIKFSLLYDGLRIYKGEPKVFKLKFDRIEREQIWKPVQKPM